jgi:hypothetical protein
MLKKNLQNKKKILLLHPLLREAPTNGLSREASIFEHFS